MTPRRLLALGAIVTIAVYVQTLWFGLVYEDVNALPIGAWSWMWLRWLRGGQAVSFWLTDWGGGYTVAHAGNLALHLVNGWLVWRIARVWLPEAAAVWAPVLTWLAPMQTEAVAYLQGRGDLLMATWVLLGISLLVCRTRSPWRWTRWTAVIVIAGLAAWTKELGIVAVPILLWTAASWRMTARIGWGVWSMVGVLALCVLGYVSQTDQFQMRAAISDQPLLNYVAMQASAWWRYVALIVWPVGLSIDHDFERVWTGWHLLALVGVGVTGWQAWRGRHHLAGWAIGAALLSIAPRFVLRQEEFMHEKHMYLAVCLLSLALASGVARLMKART